jgi:hypothetical protein
MSVNYSNSESVLVVDFEFLREVDSAGELEGRREDVAVE